MKKAENYVKKSCSFKAKRIDPLKAKMPFLNQSSSSFLTNILDFELLPKLY